MKSQLKASAGTFSVVAAVGDPTESRTGAKVVEVHGDLKSSLVLLDDGYLQLAILTAAIDLESVELRGALLATLAETLGLQPEQVITVSSHNHCAPTPAENATYTWQKAPGITRPGTLNTVGLAFINGLRSTAQRLPARLVPVTIEWGKARETRITYNRRGRRPDGRTYFIREEDRLLLDPGYTGEIDPDAVVVLLCGLDTKPVAALAFFTGHPATAYNPERPIAFGEWPQVACEQLSEKLGGAPVAFLQGCAGDINSKYLLCGTVAQSREFGGFLGDAFWQAVQARQPSVRSDLRRHSTTVQIPLAELPGEAALHQNLAEINGFIRRVKAGDAATLECVGLNFPHALTPPYRARLVEMIRPWYQWALQLHREGRAHETPRALPVDIVVARIGDIGFVGMPFEPFVRIGLKIKREAPLPCVLPCGYTNMKYAYIPDASAYADRDYSPSFFRYTKNRPPFASPAGDTVAAAAVRALREIS